MILGKEELNRIEELKHHEKLLYSLIDYLWEIWNNTSTDEIRTIFKRLGFTDEDLEVLGIEEELEYIKNGGC